MGECSCEFCEKERRWEEESDLCYRCSHDLPCVLAEENGELCCTVLDRMSRL